MFALLPLLMVIVVVTLTMHMKRHYLAEPAQPNALTDAEVDARIAELERFFAQS